MKLKDIADMKDYLENRCYCPHEIYDMTGFFYDHFYPDTECRILISGNRGAIHGIFVIANPEPIEGIENEEQIIYIEITDNKVDSCIRMDNTKNNREQIQMFINGDIKEMSIDEYDGESTADALKELMSVADAICI